MSDREIRELREKVIRLELGQADIFKAVRALIRQVNFLTAVLTPPPGRGHLAATFTQGDCFMNTALIATPPTTRQDGSALAATAIASITFQKVAEGATAETVLVTNTVVDAAVGLTLDQLAFTDATAAVGDSYTFFVTDTAGNVGALSNAQVYPANVTPPVLSPPAAGSLAATFT